MSKIESKLDAKSLAQGKTTKKEEKPAETGEKKELSKKELNKLKRKEKRGDAKAQSKEEKAAGDKQDAKAPVGPQPQLPNFNTVPAELLKALAFTELNLARSQYLGGASPST